MEEFKVNESFSMELLDNEIYTLTEYVLIMLVILNMVSFELVMIGYSYLRYFYIGIYNILISSLGFIGSKLVVIINSIFIYIFIGNYMGLIPGSNVLTSEVSNNLVLSLSVWLTCIIIGINLYKGSIYKLFMRSSVRSLILRLMLLVELISFSSRLISLTIRLTANMIGSLIMLKLIGSLVLFILSINVVRMVLLMVGIYVLEIAICVIQAYVFSLLTSLYLKDIINLFL